MTFLKFVKSKRIKVFHIRYKEGMYMFYIPTYQRFLLRHFEGEIYYHQTIGLLKYVLYLSKQYMNIIGVMFFFISVIISSYFIFDIEIIGTLPKVNQAMEKELKTLNVEKFTFLKSYERMNEILTSLKTTYKNDVEYINVYQVGSVFHVEYTKRKQEQLEKEEYQNLYAKKDGMIAYFDVDSGMIKVKQNDYVKKGDLLVENTLISTSEETKIIPVKGKVYAYTFNQYEASITNHNQDKGEAFYHLLLLIRSQLPANAKIDKENVLQMKRTRSKITLKMHYTLLEDISVKGESNEGSH
ncbi:MAG: sporulation protein YqfD [Erysipelotrichales bacterium]|nr:sporulation protein YqfD [Erysipelotrichales bacterium]